MALSRSPPDRFALGVPRAASVPSSFPTLPTAFSSVPRSNRASDEIHTPFLDVESKKKFTESLEKRRNDCLARFGKIKYSRGTQILGERGEGRGVWTIQVTC